MANLKAVIPVAGLGMHMLPATKAIPKEMLPIVDKPMIQYIVDEIVAAGIKEIVLVTHSSKNAVENHFDTSYELEALLEQRVKRQLLAEVQAICPPGVTIMNVRQAQPLGLGHSILCARPVVGDNPFVVVLPDIILDGGTADPLRYNLAAMIARFNETGRSQVLAKRMPGDLSEYSVIQTKEPMVAEGQVARIVEFIEKPDEPQTLDSDLMAVGRYVLSADIWAELERTEQKLLAEGRIAMRSRITETLERLVEASGRWKKWLLPAEEGSAFGALSAERRTWLVKTGCRYIWQEPEALVARQRLYDNLRRVGMDPEEVVLGRIEHDMDKYFYAFNLVDLNNLL